MSEFSFCLFSKVCEFHKGLLPKCLTDTRVYLRLRTLCDNTWRCCVLINTHAVETLPSVQELTDIPPYVKLVSIEKVCTLQVKQKRQIKEGQPIL